MLKDIIVKNRSYRRFRQDFAIGREILTELVELARNSASAGNVQPLKYILVNDPDKNSQVFKTLSWAAYLKDWNGPAEGERPSAYIIILGDTSITTNFFCDHGIAAQSILLGAAEKDMGGCIVANIRKEELRVTMNIPVQFEILLVIALGKPVETVKIEDLPDTGDYKYWRDQEMVHHVPKRSLHSIILPF